MQNLGPKNPFLEYLGAKLKMLAPVIFSVRNVQLSVENCNFLPAYFVTHDAAAYNI